jgi:hypothetical protein
MTLVNSHDRQCAIPSEGFPRGEFMSVVLRDVAVPIFGIPLDPPRIPGATYEMRCSAAYARAGCDWLVVYADREHLANIAFLSGFEPRFGRASAP